MASCSTPTKGFLTRLLHNEAGNTLAIVAAAIFPLAGMIGGGLDMSRLYLAKTRLQQACDAGALAGRKALGSGRWSRTTGDDAAKARFQANFPDAAYGASASTKSIHATGGTITCNAPAVLPQTILLILVQ